MARWARLTLLLVLSFVVAVMAAPPVLAFGQACSGKLLEQAKVSTMLTVDGQRRDLPHLTAAATITVPVQWDGTRRLLEENTSSEYVERLRCLLPQPDDADIDRHGEFRNRPPTVTIADGLLRVDDTVEGDLYQWHNPPLLGFWNVTTSHHRLRFQLPAPDEAPNHAPALRSAKWNVTVRLVGYRFSELQPPPKALDEADGATWEISPTATSSPIIDVIVAADQRTRLALDLGSGPRWAMSNALQTLSGAIFFILLLLLVPRARAVGGKQSRHASRNLERAARAARWAAVAGLFFTVVPLILFLVNKDFDNIDLDVPYFRRQAVLAMVGIALLFCIAMWRTGWPFTLVALGGCALAGLVLLNPSAFHLDENFNSEFAAPGAGPLRPGELAPGGWQVAYITVMTFLAAWGIAVLLLRSMRWLRAIEPIPKRPEGARRWVGVSTPAVLSLLVAVAVVAQWVWWRGDAWTKNYLFARVADNHEHLLVSHLTRSLIVYPVDLLDQFAALLWWVGIVAVLILLHQLARTEPDTVRPGPLAYRLISLLFAGAIVGSYGWYLGIPFPLAFLVSLLLIGFAVPWSGRFNLLSRIELANGTGDRRVERSARGLLAVDDLRNRLIEADEQIDVLTECRGELDAKLARGELTADRHARRVRDVDKQLDRLRAIPVSSGSGWRAWRSRWRSGGERTSLPEDVRPIDVVLALGPRRRWWANGVLAAGIGTALSGLPAAYFIYKLTAPGAWASPTVYFGALLAIRVVVEEVAFWVMAAFILGCLWTTLPGRRGVVKGMAIAAVFILATGTDALLIRLLDQTPADLYVLRWLLLLLFLATVGLLLDWVTLRAGGRFRLRSWRPLVAAYGLRRLGPAFALVLPIIATLLGIYQQLRTGTAGTQPSEIPSPPRVGR